MTDIETCLKATKMSAIFVTIESDDDFVRNTIAYGHPWFIIRDRLEAMVYELKRMGECNRMNRIASKFTKEEFDRYFTLNTNKTAKERADDYIEKVIFSPPATVVFFKDGQKVIVKCQYGDDWDEEKALAMAIVKHDHGLPVFQKCLDKAERRYPDIDISSITDKLADVAQTILRMFGKSDTEDKSCKKDTTPTSVQENDQIINLDDSIGCIYKDGWNELVEKEKK